MKSVVTFDHSNTSCPRNIRQKFIQLAKFVHPKLNEQKVIKKLSKGETHAKQTGVVEKSVFGR